jgi:membrane-associated phospholipid phosphatase
LMSSKWRTTRYPSVSALLLALSLVFAVSSSADVVIDWNRNALNAIRIGGGIAPRVFTSRFAAIMHAAVFNAVNGIEGRYAPYDPNSSLPAAPAGASKRAAAVQAAYATLLGVLPSQVADLKAERAASLELIAADETAESIALGIEWGDTVAAHALALRSGDVLASTPWADNLAIGKWQRTLPNLAAASTPQLASFTPWVMGSASQFLGTLPGPPALTSPQYAADFNETKTMGRGVRFPAPFPSGAYITTLPTSTPEQRIAVFWNGDTALFWNRIAEQVSEASHLSLSQNARLFALLNIGMADAAIACWNAKYHFEFWRPIKAIPFMASDDNPETQSDPSWTPYLVVTPSHPEYPSGHSTVSGAAVVVLGRFFGKNTSFSVDSETLPGVIRSFKRFSDALAEIHDARVWGGIHFRSACRDGSIMGQAVGDLVLKNALQPLDDDDDDDGGGNGGHGHK